MSNLSSQERQRLITMYVTQYNQTNVHITHLFNTLDDIRNNINMLVGNNVNQSQARPVNQSQARPVNQARQGTFVNQSRVYYDYTNPIDRSTYISNTSPSPGPGPGPGSRTDVLNFIADIITNNNANDQANETNQNITDFLSNFLNSSVPITPTQEQINSASRLVRYSDIQMPNSSSCAISLEPFISSDSVIQLHHCGHIFFPEEFNQWFSINVRCPVCRHDIRNTINTNTNTNNQSNNILNSLLSP